MDILKDISNLRQTGFFIAMSIPIDKNTIMECIAYCLTVSKSDICEIEIFCDKDVKRSIIAMILSIGGSSLNFKIKINTSESDNLKKTQQSKIVGVYCPSLVICYCNNIPTILLEYVM